MSITRKGVGAKLKAAARLLLAAADDVTTITAEEVQISDRTVGGKVERINADSTLTPLPDGTYQLPDGFRFTLVGGFITELGDAEEETPEDLAVTPEGAPAADPATPAVPPVEEPAAVDTELATRLATLEQQVATLTATLTELTNLMKGVNASNLSAEQAYNQFRTELSALNSAIKEEGLTPASGPRTTTPGTGANIKADKLEKQNNVASRLGSVMKQIKDDTK